LDTHPTAILSITLTSSAQQLDFPRATKHISTENSTQAGENLMLTDAHNYPRMDFQLGEIYVHFSNAHGSLVN